MVQLGQGHYVITCCSIEFMLLLGTDIKGETAIQFSAVTGSSICLHNLSVVSLQADYNPLLEAGMLVV